MDSKLQYIYFVPQVTGSMRACAQAARQRSNCPTCRQLFHAEEVSYVDSRAPAATSEDGGGGEADGRAANEEAALPITGSYGTKVS